MFILIIAAVVVTWNIGCYNLIVVRGVNLFSDNRPVIDNPSTNYDYLIIDDIIEPPMGNSTSLPKFTTLFTLMLFTFPIEIVVVFLSEMLLGSILRVEKKQMSFMRLLILLGTSLALGVASATINYVAVWPALHDIPINRNLQFNDTSVDPGGVLTPQYGGAETFFSPAVAILVLLIAAILIVGIHFPVYKFILNMNYLQSSISLALPALYYFVIWFTLSRQTTQGNFWEKTGSHFYLSLILAAGIVFLVLVILLWNMTLESRAPPKIDESKAKYES
jgi:hypothetical protein